MDYDTGYLSRGGLVQRADIATGVILTPAKGGITVTKSFWFRSHFRPRNKEEKWIILVRKIGKKTPPVTMELRIK